eukprot:TRINITY_DN1316_c0_g1_i3.p1 TRINITY_DN1316_c0_g1~~TRINITY_DN1316_c0_g1_i3.p1  ORF type:complete len:707 (-),score=161.48 TRINITY_DN1316_c0_g1_i3:405-2525(-)
MHFLVGALAFCMTAVAEPATTDALSKHAIDIRKKIYVAIIIGTAGVITLLGVAAVFKKKGELKILHLRYVRHKGLLWRNKPVFLRESSPMASGKEPLHVKAAKETDEKQIDVIHIEVEGEEEVEVDEGYDEEEADDIPFVITEADYALLQAEQGKVFEDHSNYLCARRVLLYVLLFAYVGTSLSVPILRAGTVTCDHGFYWEDHMYFLCVFAITKIAELLLYTSDPTLQGELDLVKFMILFGGSFFGYSDGYTDATSITIAQACDTDIAQKLASSMLYTYAIGVVILQWIVLLLVSFFEPTQACLLKLVHMDAVANCVTIDPKHKWMWTLVNGIRTLGEDIPQAVQQALFLIYVRKNYFMMISIAFSVGSSMKASYDAVIHVGAAAGAYLKLAENKEEGELPENKEEGELPENKEARELAERKDREYKELLLEERISIEEETGGAGSGGEAAECEYYDEEPLEEGEEIRMAVNFKKNTSILEDDVYFADQLTKKVTYRWQELASKHDYVLCVHMTTPVATGLNVALLAKRADTIKRHIMDQGIEEEFVQINPVKYHQAGQATAVFQLMKKEDAAKITADTEERVARKKLLRIKFDNREEISSTFSFQKGKSAFGDTAVALKEAECITELLVRTKEVLVVMLATPAKETQEGIKRLLDSRSTTVAQQLLRLGVKKDRVRFEYRFEDKKALTMITVEVPGEPKPEASP